MKIVFVIKQLSEIGGGAERVLCDLCSGLVAQGHAVTVITFDAPESKSIYFLDKGVKEIKLGVGDVTKPASFFVSIKKIKKMRQTIIRENPDIAVGFMHSSYILLSLSLVGTAIPVIGSEHIVADYYLSHPFEYFLLIITSPLIAKYTVPLATTRSRYPSLIRRKMIAIPNIISVNRGRKRKPPSNKSQIILSVGRLDNQKNFATLLRAFAMVKNQMPGWNLRIVGEGPERQKLEQLVKYLELENRVAMPGFVNKISAEYDSADVFVTTSLFESFGLAILEAIAHGLPAIGFLGVEGVSEHIKNFENGVLVDPGNDPIEALASTLLLLDDPNLTDKFSNSENKKVYATYSTENVCKSWLNLFHSLS